MKIDRASPPLFHGAEGVGGSGRIRIKVKGKSNIKVKGKSKIKVKGVGQECPTHTIKGNIRPRGGWYAAGAKAQFFFCWLNWHDLKVVPFPVFRGRSSVWAQAKSTAGSSLGLAPSSE